MMRGQIKFIAVLATLLGLTTLFVTAALAGEGKDMGGWGVSDPYNKYYKINEMDEFKAKIVDIIKITPLKGMSPGIGLIIQNDDDEKINVHIGPEFFVKMQFKKGEEVKIRGAWAEIEGKEVFIASKIKARDRDYTYKCRLTKDGTPFWTLDAKQLAAEQEDI